MGRRRILSAIAVYGALAAAAVGVLLLAGRPLGSHPDPWLDLGPLAQIGASVAGGLALALFGIVSTRWLVRNTRWARDLHISFRGLLGRLSGAEIAVFALTSGFAEELFFRGALQPWMGYVATSIVFGAVHLGPSRKFLPWTIWAVAMGFLFGAVYAVSGQLIGPMLAHIVVNYENLHFINSHDPALVVDESSASSSSTGPLVGGRERGGGSRSWH